MKLILERYIGQKDRTIGVLKLKKLLWDSELCYILEDEFRTEKVAGKTRIPAGTYEITLRQEGRIHNNYLAKFGSSWHKGVMWIRNIKGFEYVYIHIGTTPSDTLGCLLTGEFVNYGVLGNSTKAYQKLYPIVRDAILAGEKVEIKIIDFDYGYRASFYFLHKARYFIFILAFLGLAYWLYLNQEKIKEKMNFPKTE